MLFSFTLAIMLCVALFNAVAGETCANFMKGKDASLPCVEVPSCATGRYGSAQIHELSNGLGVGKSVTDIQLCYDSSDLQVIAALKNQNYLTNPSQFTACNDPVFNSDVFEVFITPDNVEKPTSSSPHCYNELDISPNNVMFESGIYNPNLNHSGIVGYEIDCSTSGITHSTSRSYTTWKATMSFPFTLLNCPNKCSVGGYCQSKTAYPVYRANFYRINELSAVSKCSSSTCEYLAWNPTDVNPPAFHEPTKFGYLILQ